MNSNNDHAGRRSQEAEPDGNGGMEPVDWPSVRKTARGIVIRDGRILLMERWRDGLHYFSIPGGEIEPGETPEATVRRELAEETSVDVTVGRLLYEMHDPEGHHHAVYECEWQSGEPAMSADAPENDHGEHNRFEPKWVPIEQLSGIPFLYWAPVGKQLVADTANGFGEEPVLLAAD
jgi:ADP-ribose pyrophosphatase YjhB (NUDIX family)